MSDVAIWTDSSGYVTRRHYQPSTVDTSDATILAESDIPSRPDVEPWVEVQLKYDGSTFSYEKTDPFDGLDFTNTEKHNLFEAVNNRDLVEARNIVERALST